MNMTMKSWRRHYFGLLVTKNLPNETKLAAATIFSQKNLDFCMTRHSDAIRLVFGWKMFPMKPLNMIYWWRSRSMANIVDLSEILEILEIHNDSLMMPIFIRLTWNGCPNITAIVM